MSIDLTVRSIIIIIKLFIVAWRIILHKYIYYIGITCYVRFNGKLYTRSKILVFPIMFWPLIF